MSGAKTLPIRETMPPERGLPGPPLDTVVRVETPEGVDLDLRPAGPVPRAVAFAIDAAARGAIGLLVAIVASALGQLGSSALLITLFALEWLYPFAFEAFRGGQTPGKAVVGLRVLRSDGTPLDLGAATLRNLLRAADFLPFAYGFGLASMLATRSFLRLGDLAAGTMVVHVPKDRRRAIAGDIDPEPPPQELLVEEQQAIIELAFRRKDLSEARLRELALPVAEQLWPERPASLERLFAVGAWCLGRRHTPQTSRRARPKERRRPW